MDTLIIAATGFCFFTALALLWLRRRDLRAGGTRPAPPAPQPREVGQAEEDSVPLDAALYLDLAAAMLSAGLPLPALLKELGELDSGRFSPYLRGVALKLGAGATWAQAWGGQTPQALEGVRDALGLGLETGAPSAELLTVLADRQRRHRQRQLEKSAARLGVKLVVPLGLCSLPAFICLGVLPVLIAMIPALL